MNYEDILDKEKKTKTYKDYIKNYILDNVVTGLFFGFGHFLAYALLNTENFKGLRMLAYRSQ